MLYAIYSNLGLYEKTMLTIPHEMPSCCSKQPVIRNSCLIIVVVLHTMSSKIDNLLS